MLTRFPLPSGPLESLHPASAITSMLATADVQTLPIRHHSRSLFGFCQRQEPDTLPALALSSADPERRTSPARMSSTPLQRVSETPRPSAILALLLVPAPALVA